MPTWHAAIHHDHVKRTVTEPLLRVLDAHRGDNFSSRPNQNIAFEFQHRFFVFDQKHASCEDGLSTRGRHSLWQSGFFAGKQSDFDGRSAFFAVFLDDSVADAEPKTSSLAH